MSTEIDLSITCPGFGMNDQIIDSYVLIKSIIDEKGGQVSSLKFWIDNTLPLIKGDSKYVREIFMEFIGKVFKEFKDQSRTIKIAHIKDPNSWIFTFLSNNDFVENNSIENFDTTKNLKEFNLTISKRD